jgi:uncharacterized protein (UPF0210 family)
LQPKENMNRRESLKALAATLVASLYWVPTIEAKPVRARTIPVPGPKPGLRIDQIMPVAFNAVRTEMLDGHSFVHPELRKLHEQGRIMVAPIGSVVGTQPVRQISVPMVWTMLDNTLADTEAKRIALCKQLIINGISSHDDLVLETIGAGRAVFSKEYRYDCGSVVEIPSQNTFVMKIYTIFAAID